jgi:hypothetical protein
MIAENGIVITENGASELVNEFETADAGIY